MTEDRCPVEVFTDKGWYWHVCGRPVKRNGMCGIHAAAQDRRAAKWAEALDRRGQSARNEAAAQAMCDVLAGLGISARPDYDARSHACTGGLVIAPASSPRIVALAARP